MCKIHTISKSASINRASSLNERLQYLTNAQILYWNLIGQKNEFSQSFDQLAALLASGQKLVRKI